MDNNQELHEYNITFDNDKNIISLTNLLNNPKILTSFDNNSHLIKVKKHFWQ